MQRMLNSTPQNRGTHSRSMDAKQDRGTLARLTSANSFAGCAQVIAYLPCAGRPRRRRPKAPALFPPLPAGPKGPFSAVGRYAVARGSMPISWSCGLKPAKVFQAKLHL